MDIRSLSDAELDAMIAQQSSSAAPDNLQSLSDEELDNMIAQKSLSAPMRSSWIEGIKNQPLGLNLNNTPFGVGVATALGNTAGGLSQLGREYAGSFQGEPGSIEYLRGKTANPLSLLLASIYNKVLPSQEQITQAGTERQNRFEMAASTNPIQAWAGNIGVGIASAAPLGGTGVLAKGASMIPRALAAGTTGAITGATQYAPEEQSRLVNTLLGAGIGGAMPAAGKGLGKINEYIKEKAEPLVAATGLSKMGQFIGELPSNVFGKVKANEASVKSAEEQVWNEALEMAKTPEVSNSPFSKDTYESIIDTEINKLKSASKKNPTLTGTNAAAIRELEAAKKSELNNWEDAIEARKALNQRYKEEKKAGVTTGNTKTAEAINKAMSALHKQVDINFENTPVPRFQETWKNANEITQERKKVFDTVIMPSGRSGTSPYANLKLNESDFAPTGKVIAPYIPKSKEDGVQRMKQLGSMVGSSNVAADMLRPYIFKDAVVGDQINYKKFFKKYNSLGDDQRAFLFEPEKKKFLDMANGLYENNPKVFDEKKGMFGGSIKDFIKNPSTISGLTGASLGGLVGGPAGAIVGGLSGTLASALAQKAAPSAASYYLKGAESPYAQLMSEYLAKMAPRAAGLLGANNQKESTTGSR